MDVPIAILIIAAVAAAVLALFAGLRRIARGPLLREATRGTPMGTVVGTAFAVMLAFVIFASYQTYNGAQAGAGSEAVAVLDMARTAALYPPAQRDLLRGELICYARAVIHLEWPAMRSGRSSPSVDHWIAAYRGLFDVLSLDSSREQLAFQELTHRRQRSHQRASAAPRRGQLAGPHPALACAPTWRRRDFAGSTRNGRLTRAAMGTRTDGRRRRGPRHRRPAPR